MRIVAIYIATALALIGCKSIDAIEPNQTDTFLKIFGESTITSAQDLLVLEDGYLILGTIGSSPQDTANLLIRTDLAGNKLWGKVFENYRGRSLTYVDDGYIIVGDSIDDNTNQSFMNLLKTDLEGNKIKSVSPAVPSASFGFAITRTNTTPVEIIAIGNSYSGSFGSVAIMGYNTNLSPTWQSPKLYSASNLTKTPYRSIVETTSGDLAWANVTSGTQSTFVETTFTQPDNDRPLGGVTLFTGSTINLTVGDFVQLPVGYALTQSINQNNKSKIGISIFDQNVLDENTLVLEEDFNYFPTGICNTPNGLLIASYTDYHENSNSSTRSDYDLFILETDYDGQPKANGIKGNFGGIGNELPVRVRTAHDGGYLILGNLVNTKGAEQIFLLKLNSKGELN